MNLTPHFKLAEFIASTAALRLGLSNMPEPIHLDNLRRLASTMELVRSACGDKAVTVNSGYRSPEVNKAVGGVANSAHALGLACDFTVQGHSLDEAFEKIRRSGIEYDQLIREPTWIHLGLRVGKARRQDLLAERSDKGGMVYEFAKPIV